MASLELNSVANLSLMQFVHEEADELSDEGS